MSHKIFVDTAAWIALLDKSDAFHHAATNTLQRLQAMTSSRQAPSFVTSGFVIMEVADGFSNSTLRNSAIRFINEGLQEFQGLDIVPISQELMDLGWQLYCSRLDKEWGLTDCTSFVIMNQQNILVAFTSDKHFEQAGFIRLLKP